MEKKKDLRIIKTERAIYATLIKLLRTKELEKITVSELAEKAEINKATFYLHYSDIYSLYQEALSKHVTEMIEELGLTNYMFSDPEKFSRILVQDFFDHDKMADDPFFHDRNYKYNRTISWHICNAFMKQAMALNILPDSPENRLNLEFFFTGIAFLRHEHADSENELIIQVIADSIRKLFQNSEV